MELGLTFPLQRFLKQKTDYGTQPDRRYCWDAHVIDLRGRKSLLAVHCHSRYTFVCFDVPPLAWRDLPVLFETGLRDSLTAAGFAQSVIDDYLSRAGALSLTRTHGRREVAFLNHCRHSLKSEIRCNHEGTSYHPCNTGSKGTAPLFRIAA